MKYMPHALAVLSLVSFMSMRVEAVTTGLDHFPTLGNGVSLNLKQGNAGKNGRLEFWSKPGDDLNWLASSPASHILGSPLFGIDFSASPVDVLGAEFSVRETHPSTTQGAVRVHGYRNGTQVGVTDWFTNLSARPSWFAFDLPDVDRIIIESKPLQGLGRWSRMNDLTLESAVPEPSSILALAVAMLAAAGVVCRRRR